MELNSIIQKRVERLEEYLIRLGKIAEAKKTEFLSNWQLQDSALRDFQVAIECCLDIGNHLISIMGWRSPDTYVEIVDILAEKGVLPSDFVNEAKNMARFRNILVHGYISIDIEKIYESLSEIDKIRKFVSCIVDFLVSK